MRGYSVKCGDAAARLAIVLSVSAAAAMVMSLLMAGCRREARRRAENQRIVAVLSACKEVALAAIEYSIDHHDRLPAAADWEDQLRPYLHSAAVLRLPPGPDGIPRRFAMNRALSGRRIGAIGETASVVLFLESTSPHRSAADDLQSLPPATEGIYFVVGWADGHVESYPTAARAQVVARSNAALRP